MFSTDDSKAFYFGETDFEYFTWLPEITKAMPEYAPCGEYAVWEPVSSWYGTKSAALEYGWIGQQPSSGFINLAPSILHYNWF